MRLSLSLRLALMFAVLSLVKVSAIGFYLYHSLEKELAWRDDQTLSGRLERMESLLDNTPSIDVLRQQPQLYANMLGNTDNVLWVLNSDGDVLIEINPPNLPLPSASLATDTGVIFSSGDAGQPYRLASYLTRIHQRPLTLVAGKTLTERNLMLSQYRAALWVALVIAALVAALLGWLIARAGLRPVRRLSDNVASIDVRNLDTRLDAFDQYPELQQLTARLNQMMARLEEGFLQLSRFSEDLAHEMRTPLNNLIGQSQQCLSRGRKTEDYEALLLSNLEEHERLSRMINSMLFLARAEQGAHPPATEPVSVVATIDKLLDYFSDMAEEQAVHLLNRARENKDLTLLVAPDLLRRALANLLDNALQHCPADGTIAVSASSSTTSIRLSVTNSGDAIAAEHLPRLFERFYRGDQARSHTSETGGLGLAIVQSIMALHGGRASAENNAGTVCFHLDFPHF